MKAGIIFTGSGPILLLTTYRSLRDRGLGLKLEAKGIRKFMAFEVPVETVRSRYGPHFTIVSDDLMTIDDLRVLDYDGHHVFNNFRLSELGEVLHHELQEPVSSV